MNDTRWWKYIQKLMGDQTQLEAARFIGISKSNITRWKDGARAAPDFVVKVARAYNANVLEALVEAEFITEEEAQLREINVGGVTLSDSTNEELLKEILSRSDAQARYLFGNDGDIDTIGLAPHLTPVEDMDEMPERAVAYNGPDEDAERGFNDDYSG
ncbi:helix-turn-helix domain-containing protein [Corynebacterium propinquum]